MMLLGDTLLLRSKIVSNTACLSALLFTVHDLSAPIRVGLRTNVAGLFMPRKTDNIICNSKNPFKKDRFSGLSHDNGKIRDWKMERHRPFS